MSRYVVLAGGGLEISCCVNTLPFTRYVQTNSSALDESILTRNNESGANCSTIELLFSKALYFALTVI